MVFFFCYENFSSFSEGAFHSSMSKSLMWFKPIPAKCITQSHTFHWGNLWCRGSPKSLTCFRELFSLLLPQSPCSLIPRCWCVSFPGLLSGTRWWTVCHQSVWAASQTSSFSSVPAMQLNMGEATFMRREHKSFSQETFAQHQLWLSLTDTCRWRGYQIKLRSLRVTPAPSISGTNDRSPKLSVILFFQRSDKCTSMES